MFSQVREWGRVGSNHRPTDYERSDRSAEGRPGATYKEDKPSPSDAGGGRRAVSGGLSVPRRYQILAVLVGVVALAGCYCPAPAPPPPDHDVEVPENRDDAPVSDCAVEDAPDDCGQ